MNYFVINLIEMLPPILDYHLFPFTLIVIKTENTLKEFSHINFITQQNAFIDSFQTFCTQAALIHGGNGNLIIMEQPSKLNKSHCDGLEHPHPFIFKKTSLLPSSHRRAFIVHWAGHGCSFSLSSEIQVKGKLNWYLLPNPAGVHLDTQRKTPLKLFSPLCGAPLNTMSVKSLKGLNGNLKKQKQKKKKTDLQKIHHTMKWMLRRSPQQEVAADRGSLSLKSALQMRSWL